MKTYTTNIAMDVRAYGTVTVEASNPEEARAKLTAEYVAKHFELHGSGANDLDHSHPSEIWAEGLEDDSDTEAVPSDAFFIPNGPWVFGN